MIESIDSSKFIAMAKAAFDKLNEHKQEVNDLNVFPVPDGDTGTNMTMTMYSGLEKVKACKEKGLPEISKALSQGTLMGARGNSGVILSQLFRGMSKALKDKEEIRAEDIRNIFVTANTIAYKAVMKPTEGTILTVSRKMTDKAEEIYEEHISLDKYLYLIMAEGQKALDSTPNLLPVLKEAGVVDSGGQGLMYLMEGAVENLNSEIENEVSLDLEEDSLEGDEFEYKIMVELLDMGNEEKIEASLRNLKIAAKVEKNSKLIRCEIATNSPEEAFIALANVGHIVNAQVESKIYTQEEEDSKPSKKYGFVTVSRGEGYDLLFKDLKVDKIIAGGQTMNPSTEDIYKAIEEVDGEVIYIFPNNKNILMAAKQAASLTDRQCYVVDTKSIPEALTALLTFDTDCSPTENYENMLEAIRNIKLVELTYSVRDTSISGIQVKKGSYIGILDNNLVATGRNMNKTLDETLTKAIDDDSSLLTIFYGEDVKEAEAQKIASAISKKYKDLDIEVVYGGQPLYYYTVTIE